MASAETRREELKAVWQQAQACTKCPQLASTRTKVVFGSGNADADLMFVGEAPGANEDEQGLPFVGQAGRLLDTLLGEIGLTREDVFVANVLKCRPPGNRDPLPRRDRRLPGLPVPPARADRAAGRLHARELRDEAAARAIPAPASRACTGARRSARSGRGRCGCTRSTTRPRRSTRRRCSTSCGPTSGGSPSCWRCRRPTQPEPAVEPELVVPEPEVVAEVHRPAEPEPEPEPHPSQLGLF